MLTPQQISAALKISSAVTLNNPAAPYNTIVDNDVTNWTGALGLVPGTDTAKLLIQVLNPTGTPVYTNPGWNTNNFSQPDIQFNINTNGPLIPLPVLTGTNTVLSGQYTVQIMFSVVQGGNPAVTGVVNFITNIQAANLLRNPQMSGTYSCDTSPTTFTATDTTVLTDTVYQFQSVNRNITITPPVASGQNPTTGAGNTLTINNLWAPAPYQYSVTGVVNFTLGADTFAVNYTFADSTDVVCDSIFCQMACWLRKISEKFRREKNATEQNILIRQWMLGWDDFQTALAANRCGDQTAYSEAIKWFICDTKFDPNCSCCENLPPMPVIPSGAQGPPGPDGKTAQFQTQGGWVQWKYTTDLGWTNLFQIPTGLPGPAGQNGTNGTNGNNGTAILYNNFSGASNVGTGHFEALDSFELPANTLQQVGSEVIVRAVFTSPTSNSSRYVTIYLNGTTLLDIPLLGGVQFYTLTAANRIEIVVRLVRISANQIRYDAWWNVETQAKSNLFSVSTLYYDEFATGYTNEGKQSAITISADFTMSQLFQAMVVSDTVGNITSESMQVYVNQFGANSLPVVYGKYANDAAAAAGGVPLGGYYINSGTGAITLRQT